MAVLAIVKTMSSKRWIKAVDQKSPVPKALVENLQKTIATARDMGLSLPGGLQAKALGFCKDKVQ